MVQLWGYRCERCGHEWLPRDKDQEPRVCPKCKSPYWNVPRKAQGERLAAKVTDSAQTKEQALPARLVNGKID